MMYNKLVEANFFNPRHVGVVDLLSSNLSAYCRRGEAGRGDILDLYLLCNKKGIVEKARFKAFGNPYLVAAAEWLCRQLEGSSIYQHPCYDFKYLLQLLEIPQKRYFVALFVEDSYRELVELMKTKLKGEV
ncbi:MAG: iron-sulfur cluster assembly scaffold protein [Tatlockia sp.]|nr:iron-sulfur cluster assembly scaffold protein [Tatlockia sp.]